MNRAAMTALRKELGISVRDWRVVRDAAKDAHLPVEQYCRLMVLAASGMGGVTEHLERAIEASCKVAMESP